MNEERYAKKTDISSIDLIGTTDISSIGDGTVTGVIVKNGSDIGQVIQQITDKKSALLVDLNPEIKFNGN